MSVGLRTVLGLSSGVLVSDQGILLTPSQSVNGSRVSSTPVL